MGRKIFLEKTTPITPSFAHISGSRHLYLNLISNYETAELIHPFQLTIVQQNTIGNIESHIAQLIWYFMDGIRE